VVIICTLNGRSFLFGAELWGHTCLLQIVECYRFRSQNLVISSFFWEAMNEQFAYYYDNFTTMLIRDILGISR